MNAKISSFPAAVAFCFLPSIRVPRDSENNLFPSVFFCKLIKDSLYTVMKTRLFNQIKEAGRHKASLSYVQLGACRQREEARVRLARCARGQVFESRQMSAKVICGGKQHVKLRVRCPQTTHANRGHI